MPSIAQQQRAQILSLLRQNKLSRAEIATTVGVSELTVREYFIDLLEEHAVLLRAVCNELRTPHGRAGTALELKRRWSSLNMDYPGSDTEEIELIEEDCRPLLDEIADGERVCRALSLHGTADSASDAESDESFLHDALEKYWKAHENPAPRPERREVTLGDE